ncbi:MAG: AAA-like domain-containing protein [Chlamydiales bacterium]
MKKFCIAGPIDPERHYFIAHRLKCDQISSLIDDQEYFVLHAPRQSGKTTAIDELVHSLNREGRYAALYINIEAAQAARDHIKDALITIINIIAREINRQLPQYQEEVVRLREMAAIEPVSLDLLTSALAFLAETFKKPLALFIDEIDALIGDSLLSVLRQIRAGFKDRPAGFPQSICLIGLRDVRDYRVWSKEQGIYVSTSSPFNIKAESLTIANFTKSQVQELYNQHTEATGQVFTENALEHAYYLTQGQPWLVNALAYQACFRDVLNRSIPINKETIERSKKQLILRRDTHIDSLIDKLTEERIVPIIDAIISSESPFEAFKADDVQYLRDLGLIASDSFAIANPIYKEIIPRELTQTTQERIRTEEISYKNSDGTLNFSTLMKEFTQFYRENSGPWLHDFTYKESGPHLLLMAYLQRVINGGGDVRREYAVDRKRIDLLVLWKDQRIVIEIKIRRGEQTRAKGLEQITQYCDLVGAQEAHLVLIDRDIHASWKDKISYSIEIVGSLSVHVWTM